MDSRSLLHASMHALHDCAHMRHTSLWSACSMHSSMHCWHMAMHASSMATMVAGVIPCIRSIARIIVLHMSAQFMHAGAHDIIWVEHTVHACSHAEQASIQACSRDMSIVSMPGIDIMSFDMASIIMASISRTSLPSSSSLRRGRSTPPDGIVGPWHGAQHPRARLEVVLSREVHKRRSSPAARWAATVVASLVALSSLAFVAPPAAAHDELISAAPAADESVEAIPAEVRLVFSGVLSPEAGATAVDVVDGAGASIADGEPVVEENTVTQALDTASGASGEIRVLWRVVSSDGHPISGEYTFTVAAAPAPTPTGTATTEPSTPATTTPTPTPEATTPAPSDDGDSTFGDVWPWVLLGVLVIAVGGAVIYLLVSRARRENALRERGVGTGDPGSQPPADH